MKKVATLGIALAVFFLLGIGLFSFFNDSANATFLTKDVVMQNLPELNDKYLLYQREIEQGGYIDLCSIPEDVYLRPEFYQDWDRYYNSRYASHNYIRWVTNAYGTYPSGGISVGNLKEGEEITTCTFIKSGYGTETYLGLKLVPVNNEYFETVIQPSIFMLEPTFPIIQKGWVKKIQMTFRAKKDVPIGEYVLGFNVERPPSDIEKMFSNDVANKEVSYRSYYKEGCEEQVKNLDLSDKENQDIYDCEKLEVRTQNKYINGGDYDNGINTNTFIIKVVSE